MTSFSFNRDFTDAVAPTTVVGLWDDPTRVPDIHKLFPGWIRMYQGKIRADASLPADPKRADLHLTVERQIAEGDWVVTQVTAQGVHTGVWMGIEPTGKPVEFSCVNVDKVIDGRIVEHGGAANMLGPLLKIGAVRVVGPEDKQRSAPGLR